MALVIHPRTEQSLSILGRALPQSVLISGPSGVGLLSIAKQIAGKDAIAIIQPQDSKEQIDSNHGTISVEMVRRLYDQTRTKHIGRAIVIIDNADRMNGSAQSAFLKLLEEPNESIYFILTSHQPQLLKTTIRSRVQETVIQQATAQQTDALIADLGITDTTKRAQLNFIASGLPAEIARLIGDEAYFAKRAAIIADARTLLQGSAYDRLLVAQKYHSTRDDALQLIDSTVNIARRSLSTKPQTELIHQLEQLEAAREAIAMNGNIRLQLAHFAL